MIFFYHRLLNMARLVIVLTILIAAASAGRRGPLPADLVNIPNLERSLGITDRIVGGEIVEPNSIPFQISMQECLTIRFQSVSSRFISENHWWDKSLIYGYACKSRGPNFCQKMYLEPGH